MCERFSRILLRVEFFDFRLKFNIFFRDFLKGIYYFIKIISLDYLLKGSWRF